MEGKMNAFEKAVLNADNIKVEEELRPIMIESFKLMGQFFNKNAVALDFERLFQAFLYNNLKIYRDKNHEVAEKAAAHFSYNNKIVIKNVYDQFEYNLLVFTHEFIHFMICNAYAINKNNSKNLSIDTINYINSNITDLDKYKKLPSWANEMLTEYYAYKITNFHYASGYQALINVAYYLNKYIEPITPQIFFNGELQDYINRNHLYRIDKELDASRENEFKDYSKKYQNSVAIYSFILREYALKLAEQNLSIPEYLQKLYDFKEPITLKLGKHYTRYAMKYISQKIGTTAEKDKYLDLLKCYSVMALPEHKNFYNDNLKNPFLVKFDDITLIITRVNKQELCFATALIDKNENIYKTRQLAKGKSLIIDYSPQINAPATIRNESGRIGKFRGCTILNFNGVVLGCLKDSENLIVLDNPNNKLISITQIMGTPDEILAKITKQASIDHQIVQQKLWKANGNNSDYASKKTQNDTNSAKKQQKTTQNSISCHYVDNKNTKEYNETINYINKIVKYFNAKIYVHKATPMPTGDFNHNDVYANYKNAPTVYKLTHIGNQSYKLILSQSKANVNDNAILSIQLPSGINMPLASMVKLSDDNEHYKIHLNVYTEKKYTANPSYNQDAQLSR